MKRTAAALALLLLLGCARSEPLAEKCKTRVFVTETGEMYHTEGCPALDESCIEVSLEEAKAHWRPCSKCHPPK